MRESVTFTSNKPMPVDGTKEVDLYDGNEEVVLQYLQLKRPATVDWEAVYNGGENQLGRSQRTLESGSGNAEIVPTTESNIVLPVGHGLRIRLIDTASSDAPYYLQAYGWRVLHG